MAKARYEVRQSGAKLWDVVRTSDGATGARFGSKRAAAAEAAKRSSPGWSDDVRQRDPEAIYQELLAFAQERYDERLVLVKEADRQFLRDPAIRAVRFAETIAQLAEAQDEDWRQSQMRAGILESTSLRRDLVAMRNIAVAFHRDRPVRYGTEFARSEIARLEAARVRVLDLAFPPEDLAGRARLEDPSYHVREIENEIASLSEKEPGRESLRRFLEFQLGVGRETSSSLSKLAPEELACMVYAERWEERSQQTPSVTDLRRSAKRIAARMTRRT